LGSLIRGAAQLLDSNEFLSKSLWDRLKIKKRSKNGPNAYWVEVFLAKTPISISLINRKKREVALYRKSIPNYSGHNYEQFIIQMNDRIIALTNGVLQIIHRKPS
jgi:hypothetical protein